MAVHFVPGAVLSSPLEDVDVSVSLSPALILGNIVRPYMMLFRRRGGLPLTPIGQHQQ